MSELPADATRWLRAKHAVNRRLNPGDGDSKWVDTFIITLIALNVLIAITETHEPTHQAYLGFFTGFEIFSSVFFTIEYVLRLWVAPLDPRFARPVSGRARFALTPMALVDLVAIVPFYVEIIFRDSIDLRIARAIRLFRLVRILKMGRYAYAMRTLGAVFVRKKEELAITSLVCVMLVILTSSVMYFAEHEAQPEAFASIPSTMWWSIITLTSVGYGDVYPITEIGKIMGAFIALIGVLFVALPTGIISAGFLEQMREEKRGKDSEIFGYCPHCGEQLIPGEELE